MPMQLPREIEMMEFRVNDLDDLHVNLELRAGAAVSTGRDNRERA